LSNLVLFSWLSEVIDSNILFTTGVIVSNKLELEIKII
jgi:hypothetical protein